MMIIKLANANANIAWRLHNFQLNMPNFQRINKCQPILYKHTFPLNSLLAYGPHMGVHCHPH